MEQIPLYKETATYALEHGELDAYRASYKANTTCRRAIEEAIDNRYQNNIYDSQTVLMGLIDEFGADRVSYILAHTVKASSWDGRFSRENNEWAQSVVERDATISEYNVRSHPGLVDMLVSRLREQQERAGRSGSEKKPRDHGDAR